MKTTSQDFLPCNLKHKSKNNIFFNFIFFLGGGGVCVGIYIRVILPFLLSNFISFEKYQWEIACLKSHILGERIAM